MARLKGYADRVQGDFDTLGDQVAALLTVYGDHEAWQVRQGASTILHWAALRRPDDFAVWFTRVLAEENPLQLDPGPLVHTAIEALGSEYTRELIEGAPPASRVLWLRTWFYQLPPDRWGPAEAEACASMLEEAPSGQIWRIGDLIDSICRTDGARGTALLRRLADRGRGEPDIGHVLALEFSDPQFTERPVMQVFRLNPDVFETLYLAGDAVDLHSDLHAKLFSELVTLRAEFATRWVQHVLEREDAESRRDDQRSYECLWRRLDWHSVLGAMCRVVFSTRQTSWYRDSYLHSLLSITDGTPDAVELARRQDALLGELIVEVSGDQERTVRLFAGIALLPAERRGTLIGRYLATIPPIDHFRRLMLEPNMWTYMGSRVPTLELRRSFVNGLLAHCDRPELLGHAAVLEARLRELDGEIAAARRDDFIDH
jgi:hypothetical protein